MDFKPTRTILNAFSRLAHVARVNLDAIQTERDDRATFWAHKNVRAALEDGSDLETALLASLQEFAGKKLLVGSGRRPYFDGARDVLADELALRADLLAEPFGKACARLDSTDQVELAALSLGRAVSWLSNMASGNLVTLRLDGSPLISPEHIERNMVLCAKCLIGISKAWEKNSPANVNSIDNLACTLRVLQAREEDPSKLKRLDRVAESFALALADGSTAYLAALRTKYSEFGLGSCDVLEHAAAIRESVSIAPAVPASARRLRKRTL